MIKTDEKSEHETDESAAYEIAAQARRIGAADSRPPKYKKSREKTRLSRG